MNTRKGLGIFLGLVCALAVLLGFTACGDDDAGGGNLIGTWRSQYGDSFTVTETTFSTPGWSPVYGYSGNIIKNGSDSLTSTSGYLVLLLTSAGSANAFREGEFICIFWKNLSQNSVQEAGPAKSTGEWEKPDYVDLATGEDSASAAKAKFTVENGFFDGSGIYTKQ